MSAFRLRRAGPEDAFLLSRLKIATFQLTYRGILPDGLLASLDEHNPHLGVEAWREHLHEADNEVFIVEAAEPVGFLALGSAPHELAPARGLLDQIYLLPAWQGLGWGGLLWDWAAEHLVITGRSPFALTVFEGNDRARRLYERRGARILDCRPAFHWSGQPVYELVYLIAP